MDDLHIAYQETPRLTDLLALWDQRVASEPPITRQRWTDIALWPAARSATVAGSTGIEGNPLTALQVEDVLSGGAIDARPRDLREVLNYNSALDLANRVALRADFEWEQELLRRLNATIVRDLPDDERGEYRQGPVTVGGIYSPPDFRRIPALMASLVLWLNQPGPCHPLIRAGLTHLNVVSIHPWLNGNGRTARVAGSLMLMRCGVGAPELLNIESEIRADIARYARVLQTTHGPGYDPENHSATEWLEYFAEICVGRLEIRNRIMQAIPGDVGLVAMELGASHPGMEWTLLLMAARLAPVRTATMANLADLSPSRVRAMLATLSAEGWLVSEGQRRGRRYLAGPRLIALPLRIPELMDRFRRGSAARD